MESVYPIKYTVVPLFKKDKNGHNFIAAYIVSKCFITGIITRFNSDGNKSTTYEVVLPFKSSNDKRVSPEYSDGTNCTNAIVVDLLFDNYDFAKEKANDKNKSLDSYEYLEDAHVFEDYIEANTMDLSIYKEELSHAQSLKRVFKEIE